MKTYSIQMEVSGSTAMWTRPDTGDSPVSYPLPTFSAAKGLFEGVVMIETVEIVPTKVEICKPIIYHNYATNYGGPLRKGEVVKKGGSYQLLATTLINVCYRLYAEIRPARFPRPLSEKAQFQKNKGLNAVHACQEMFNRRLEKGQWHDTPFLGWREFVPDYIGPFRETSRVQEDISLDLPSFLYMNEQEPIMISALNHYLFCPRRCGLVHVEQVWSENLFTMRGNDVHDNVHDDSSHEVAGVSYERALPIWSRRLNLTGKADLVEFHDGIPYPVEYKSGRHKEFDNDFTQLCAQALCLEEMFSMPVEKGALYWHGSRERREIVFTDAMKRQVEDVALKVAEMLEQCIIPPPVNDKRCEDCSLKESCLPAVVADKQRNRKAARELFVI